MAVAKYKIIEDNLGNIRQWIEEGLFEYQIYKRLGISKPTWEKYKKEKAEFRQILEQGRETRNATLVPELVNLMLMRARGYIDNNALTETIKYVDEDGGEVVKTRTVSKSIPPDVGAIQICLKNFTRDNASPWTDNPQGDKLKKQKQDLEIQKMEDELNGW